MKIHHYFSVFIFSFFIFLFLGCEKDKKPTIIKGTVTDRKTGKPLDRVAIEATAEQYEKDREGRIVYTTVHGLTDATGAYLCVLDGKTASADFQKNDYLDHDGVGDFRDGEENIKDISLVPLDGYLSLKIQNVTGQYDTVFVVVLSPIKVAENGTTGGDKIQKYPLLLKQNESYTEVFKLATPYDVKIYWRHTKLGVYNEKTVSVVTKDTVTHTLTY